MSTVSFLLFFCVCLYLQSLVAAIFSSNNDITSALSSFSLRETDYFANYVAPTLTLMVCPVSDTDTWGYLQLFHYLKLLSMLMC